MLPATIACDSLLPPVKSEILSSNPCFLKMPTWSPTWTGRNEVDAASALPTVIVNDLLQGNPERSASALGRLAINSTAGLGGLFDVASDAGLPPHEADFGQTFGVWGIGEGPYLFLPFFGPSNPRDAFGTALCAHIDQVYATSVLAHGLHLHLRGCVGHHDNA